MVVGRLGLISKVTSECSGGAVIKQRYSHFNTGSRPSSVPCVVGDSNLDGQQRHGKDIRPSSLVMIGRAREWISGKGSTCKLASKDHFGESSAFRKNKSMLKISGLSDSHVTKDVKKISKIPWIKCKTLEYKTFLDLIWITTISISFII